jgi:putative colanic acid biosynthesis UDP-glucose lipid carrier transferase
MNFVNHPTGVDLSEAVPAVPGQPYARRKWPIRYDSLELLTVASDFATVVLASVVASILYHFQESGTPLDFSKSFGAGILVSTLFVSLMKIQGMYNPTELLAVRKQVRAVCLTWVSVLLLLSGTVFALKIGSEISRGTSMLFAICGVTALIVHRVILKYVLKQGLANRRLSGRNIVLITDDSQTGDTNLTHTLSGLGFRVKENFVLPTLDSRQRYQTVVARVVERISGSEVEEIMIGADPNRWSELRDLVAGLRVLPVPVRFIPLGTSAEIFRRPSRKLGEAISVELKRGPLTSLEEATKRCIDALFAGFALLALLPLLAIVAIAIKLDSPGPILFRQQRCGFNGRCFQIFKFRTMTVLEDGHYVSQVQFADERVTRVGRWLRRTSIDELPQLLNVLNGDMCLVGPRPHALAHDNEFDKMVRNYAFRRRVKPGLTGWAQVNGCRGPTPTAASVEQRVQHDLWYIDNWSLWLDFKILLQTPFELLRGRNAC